MNAMVIPTGSSLTQRFSTKYGIDQGKVFSVLKSTAFKTKDGPPSDEQMAALMIVADQYGLNPFTKEIYAFPDKQNGIVPVVGVDGWSRIINTHAQFDGMEFVQSEATVTPEESAKSCPEWIECKIYRKDRSHPITVREYLDETYRKAFKGSGGYTASGPWQSHTKRMLRHKAMIQCARIAFGFVGIYDEDEAERIVEAIAVIEKTPEQEESEKVARFKAAHDEALGRHSESVAYIQQAMADKDWTAAATEWGMIPEVDQRALWVAPTKGGVFTTAERGLFRTEIAKAAAEIAQGIADREDEKAAAQMLGITTEN